MSGKKVDMILGQIDFLFFFFFFLNFARPGWIWRCFFLFFLTGFLGFFTPKSETRSPKYKFLNFFFFWNWGGLQHFFFFFFFFWTVCALAEFGVVYFNIMWHDMWRFWPPKVTRGTPIINFSITFILEIGGVYERFICFLQIEKAPSTILHVT